MGFSRHFFQSQKGTPLLTLMKDPYILIAAGKINPEPAEEPSRGHSCFSPHLGSNVKLKCICHSLYRSHLLWKHGDRHDGADAADLDDGDDVCGEVATRLEPLNPQTS